jgi:glucose-1-phosphatase
MDFKNIKNIIFDFGDVIINIDIPLTTQAFADLCEQPFDDIATIFAENEIFRKVETGLIDEVGFRNYLRSILGHPEWSDQTIDTAWCTLLLDIPPARIELIQQLDKRYRLFLLSNTSAVHINESTKILQRATGVPYLGLLFEKMFLSYQMGIMKPAPQIYQQVLAEANIVAEETVFLDDNLDNIQAAAALGIQTIHVQKPTSITEYLSNAL